MVLMMVAAGERGEWREHRHFEWMWCPQLVWEWREGEEDGEWGGTREECVCHGVVEIATKANIYLDTCIYTLIIIQCDTIQFNLNSSHLISSHLI